MKPLIRWTVGPVKPLGLKILKLSILNIKKLYGDQFDLILCFNQIQPSLLKHLDIELYDQSKYKHKLPEPIDELWKIYPPRLRINCHEIVMDNDLIVFEKLIELDQFINNDATLLLAGKKRYYGQYDNIVPSNFYINSGFYGMPPNFDFEKKIKKIHKGNWIQNRKKELFDDQGIIAGSLLSYPQKIIISNDVIFNYNTFLKDNMPSHIKGIHFINANTIGKHIGWNEFLKKTSKIYL
jgi:hypothetical protein